MSFIDRYSYIIVSLVLLVAGGFIAYESPTHATLYGVIDLLLGAALVIYWVAARRGALTPVNPSKRIKRGLTSERPVVVHFYHDYSLGSLFNRMFTWKAERDCKGHADFIYIDAAHRDAAPVLEDLEAEVGDWVLFDAAGSFVEKVSRISTGKIEELRHRPVH